MALGLRKNDKAKVIASVPLFAGLSKKELSQVASIADELDFKAGKTLIREGDPGREFFVLLEGSAEVTRGGKTIDTCAAGDFFGEVALIHNRTRTASVTTTAPSVALVITDRDFRDLVQKSPQIALKVLEAVAARLPADDY